MAFLVPPAWQNAPAAFCARRFARAAAAFVIASMSFAWDAATIPTASSIFARISNAFFPMT